MSVSLLINTYDATTEAIREHSYVSIPDPKTKSLTSIRQALLGAKIKDLFL